MSNTKVKDRSSHQTRPKDKTEERLERLLFGDRAGFLQELENQHAEGQLSVKSPLEAGIGHDEEDVENLADENLFFLDSGAAPLPHEPDAHSEREDKEEGDNRRPAWIDSDDDRLFVSLSSNQRLRKLRLAETEDIINGREYVKRLRSQYERLHPTPKWAVINADIPTRTRRRRRSDGSKGSSSADEGAESDISDDDLHVQPTTPGLADLLRNAGSLTRPTSSNQQSSGQLRLRPEVVNIQRTKDVTATGPSSVDCLQFHPDYPLLIASGPSSTVSIYQIALDQPNPNPLLTSLHVKKTPLHSTAFLPSRTPQDNTDDATPDSTMVYLSSRRRYIHTWSLDTGHVSRISRPFTSSPHLRTTQRSTEAFRLSPCGRYIGFIGSARKGGGTINVFSTLTGLQWLCSCRVDGRGGVADFAWWGDGNGFVVAGKNGECSEYDVRERRVVGRWIDDGAVGTTVIALGGGGPQSTKHKNRSKNSVIGPDRWVAVGSSSGIVNIYNRSQWLKSDKPTGSNSSSDRSDIILPPSSPPPPHQQPSTTISTPPTIPKTPTPTRTFPHLTTPTSHLLISPDGQLLVMASRWKKDALRLIHLPSCTVYRNWPTQKTALGRVASVALSRAGPAGPATSGNGGTGGPMLLAVGNEQGAIRLWEIRA